MVTSNSDITTDYTFNLPTCEVNHEPIGSCESGKGPDFSPYEPKFISNSEYFGYPIYEQSVCYGAIRNHFYRCFRQFAHKINRHFIFFKVNLICPKDLVLHIYSAYYGIQRATSSCSSYNTVEPAKCYFKESFTTIRQTCEYSNGCILKADNSLFKSDPCPNYSKQLFVQYQCLEMVSFNN